MSCSSRDPHRCLPPHDGVGLDPVVGPCASLPDLPVTAPTSAWAGSPFGDGDEPPGPGAGNGRAELAAHNARQRSTPRRLRDAGRRAFATEGVDHASLLGIAQLAGQHNRAAVHYHFGSRAGFLAAVLSDWGRHWRRREDDLLLEASTDSAGMRGIVEAIVRPPIELCLHQPGRDHIVIVNELLSSDLSALDAPVLLELRHAQHIQALDLLSRLVPPASVDARSRLAWVLVFLRHAVLEHARSASSGDPAVRGRDPEAVVQTLTDLGVALVGSLTADMAPHVARATPTARR